MNQATVTIIDYFEFEALVAEHLGDAGFEFCVDQGCGNDTEHLFGLAPITVADGTRYGWEHEIKEYERLAPAHGENPFARPTYYLAKLIEKGIIPAEHDVLVTVSW